MTAIIASPHSLLADLDPVRRALLSETALEAETIAAKAATASAAAIDEATKLAQRSVDETTEQSHLSAAAAGDQELARVRQQAAARVLAARSEVQQQMLATTREAFLALRHEADYATLLDRLTHVASEQLGPDASITRDPEPDGGIIATHGSKLVDYTLPALADRALAALADQVNEMWS